MFQYFGHAKRIHCNRYCHGSANNRDANPYGTYLLAALAGAILTVADLVTADERA